MSGESKTKYVYDVFLSYSSHDKTWADAACSVLERQRLRCWIAPRDIIPGDEWGASIIKGINESRIMVLIFSSHANASGQVRREVDRAISQGMTVMTIRIEDIPPDGAMEYALSNTHWLDAFSLPAERHLEMIARSVKTLLNHNVEEKPTPAPEPTIGAGSGPNRRLLWLGLAGSLVAVLLTLGILFVVNHRDPKPLLSSETPVQRPVETTIKPTMEKTPVPVAESATKPAAEKPKVSIVEIPKQPVEKSTLPTTRPFFVDEFNNNRTGLARDLKTPPKPNPGRSDGFYYVFAPLGRWSGWDMHRFASDTTCEVVGRVFSDKPNTGSWSVIVHNTSGSGRGFRIMISVKGELFLEPNPWPNAKDFVDIDPKIGPIKHSAIKPGNEYNKLFLIVRKRQLVIMVNDVQVCRPVNLEYDITPCKLQLGVAGGGTRRAEFDRLEIREITNSDREH